MMRPATTLSALCIGASILGAQLYVQRALHRAPRTTPTSSDTTTLNELQAEVASLRQDNRSLRALLAAAAPVEIDPALISFVEKDLGAHFSTPPIAFTRSHDALYEAASRLWIDAFTEEGISMRGYAYESLGILPPGQPFLSQLLAAETLGAIGIYDHTSGEIILAQDYDDENIHHQAALVRLLAIALLEQQYPLPATPNDDTFYCYLATHRGRAAMLEDRYYSIKARTMDFVSTPDQSEAAELFETLPPLLQQISAFPKNYGKSYLGNLNTPAEITAALASTTLSTQQLLTGKTATTQPASEKNFALSTQLGALTLRGYLDQLENSPSTQLLPHYLSDTLTLDSDPEHSTITWTLLWDSPEAASDFLNHARTLSEPLSQPPTLSQDSTRTTLSIHLPHTQLNAN